MRNLPPGAVRLSRQEIIAAADRYKQRKEGKKWRFLEDSWPVFSGISCCLTSVYIISIVRHKFKLGRYHARGIQYISASAFPTLFVPYLFFPYVADSAMIKEVDCADCLGVRGGLIQAAGAVFWASALASIGALYYAKRFYTVPLPPIRPKYFKDYCKILAQPYKPAMHMIFAHSAVQFSVGYIGGIKFWYRGQELNFVEAYIGQKTRELYGFDVDAPYPQFTRRKIEVDPIIEFIANANWANLLGRTIAADTSDEDDNDNDDDVGMIQQIVNYFVDYPKKLLGLFGFGKD